jgi:gliding motility-associated-like protein
LENPDFTKLNAGTHSIKLTVESNLGCVSDPFTNNITIKPKPDVAFDTKDGCVNTSVLFSAEQTDGLPTITNWRWDFGDGIFSDKKDTQLIFTQKGNYPVTLTAVSASGCESSFSKNIFINEASANAGSDTLVVPETFFNLSGSGGASYLWSPATGLSDPGIANPTASISDETTYHLTVTTAEGCTDTASVHISVFKGSGLYVPTAFTPNGDGLNDILRPYYIGIKSLSYFTIFNSWGQKVFSTKDMKAGWNGSFKGSQSNAGSYVWVLKATDVVGKPFDLKGSFVLIR